MKRLSDVRAALAAFPDSVLPEVYALRAPPPLARLGDLVGVADLEDSSHLKDSVLAKFVRRLRGARPDLSAGELLELFVPATVGDQEVFLARLGKWRFELRQLERALTEG